MDSTTPIDISATGSPAATENIITILSWTGTILWLILSTLAIAFITSVSGRHIHARCKFRPIVSQYGSESMPYEVIPEIYCVVHTVAYGMTTLLVGTYCMVGIIRLDMEIALLEVLSISLAVQGTLHS